MKAPRFMLLLALVASLGAMFAGCGEASDTRGSVTVEPAASATVRAVPTGGKPAASPPTHTATVLADTATAVAPDATPVPPEPTATFGPVDEPTSAPVVRPSTGRWIDVDVTNYVVTLMDGENMVQTIAPVGVGVQVDTGEYASTQTGLFHVNSKVEALAYDAPYDTYISHWVGFDADKDNGFHSLLKDAAGVVVDPSTGRVSNGCIRTGEAEAVFAFAEIGMPVLVHW